jgi:hypothetical protein
VKPQADFNLVFELPLKKGFRQAETHYEKLTLIQGSSVS